jgi:23S rRNA pseudouridine2605 synthase
MTTERLQKILARAGIASRRAAEELIVAGRVKVDGHVVTELGSRADPRRSNVEVDGRRIMAEPLVYIALHKPKNVMCTLRDPEGRPTVIDYVKNIGLRLVPVGRLDFHTSGVLLLTNDGDFAEGLMHPRRRVPKVYVAKVQGELDDRAIERWRRSIVIDGRATQPAEVKRLRTVEGKTWIEVTLREGRNRQVRRLGEASGAAVVRLARVAYAGITVEGLRPGQWRHLGVDEMVDLKRAYGVPKRVRPAELPERARPGAPGRGERRSAPKKARASVGRARPASKTAGGSPDRARSASKKAGGSPDRARPASKKGGGSPDRARPASKQKNTRPRRGR